MCRSVIEGGLRCKCDTSEARRLRRHNSEAISQYKEEAKPRFVAKPQPVKTSEPGSIEVVKEKINDIKSLRELIEKHSFNNNMPELMPVPSVTLSDGTLIDGRTPVQQLFNVIEKTTVELGDNINLLTEKETGITTDSIIELNSGLVEKLTKAVDDIKELRAGLELEKAEVWPNEYNDEGKLKRGFQMLWREAYHDGNPKAVELYEKGNKSLDDHVKAQHALSQAVNGRDEETLALVEGQRTGLMKVLQEIRPMGGNIESDGSSTASAVKTLKVVEKMYPTSWIEASNEREPFVAKSTSSRAHYADQAYQKNYKVVPRRSFSSKPEGWQPNPLNRHEVGEWNLADEYGTWVDPETNMEYTSTPRIGERTWIYTPVEYYRSFYNEELLTAPPGRGWQKVIHNEKARDQDTGEYIKKDVVNWYRPIKKRTLVSTEMKAELTISGKGPDAIRVGLHEFAHRVEASGKIGSYIKTVEETFLNRRTTNAAGERESLVKLYPRSKEFSRPDNFASAYMGKIYDQGYREVLSTGAEAVFSNSYGGLVGLGNNTPDRDMKNLIVGLWASA